MIHEVRPIGRNDLEKMIALAEEVSTRANELGRLLQRLRLRQVVALVVLYVALIFMYLLSTSKYYVFIQEIEWGIMLGLITVGGAAFFVLYAAVVSHKAARQEQRLEFHILTDLLDRSFEAMKYLGDELSTFDRALLEIRMQRIKFYLKT